MREALFKPLIESLEKSTSQKPDSVCRPKIEWALSNSIDRFFQEVAHVSDGFQVSVRQVTACVNLPTAILLSSLSTQLRQPLGVSVAKTQVSYYGWCLAGTTGLCPSLALFSTPFF
jgi:hypothetical protein